MLAPDLSPRQNAETAHGSDIHNRIFAASIEILVESGFSQACTNHIAERAGVSVGSIYRFYPNKHAIYHAISVRYLEGICRIVCETVQLDDREKPWAEVVDEFVEQSARFYQKNAALQRAWNVLLGNPETRAAEARIAQQANKIWADYLTDVVPGFSDAEYRRISVTIFWLVTSLLELSTAAASGMDRELVEETKIAAKAYLGTALASKLTEG
jgi:AcrR family transcriptional regulator